MSTISAMHTALFGIRENLRSFEETVRRISKTAPLGDLPGDLVALKVSKYGVQANTLALRAGDEMTGTLLDILA